MVRTPPRILVADDNPDNLEIFQARLAAHGYEILTACDGEAALASAKEARPDAILLDVMMPKMNGIEVCRRIKVDASLPFMPIIMVTAKTSSQDVVAGLDAGADEYLAKPVDQAALVARVKSMLASRRSTMRCRSKPPSSKPRRCSSHNGTARWSGVWPIRWSNWRACRVSSGSCRRSLPSSSSPAARRTRS